MLHSRKQADGQPAFFVHLPSCGGTTFWTILRMAYGQKNTRRFTKIKRNQREYLKNLISDQAAEMPRAVGGHVFYPVANDVFPDRQFITFLRHPVERAISVYHRKVRNQIWDGTDANDARGLIDFWRSRPVANQLSTYFSPSPDRPGTVDEVVETVSDRLAGFGLMENFDQSLFLLAEALGWDRVPVYVRRNIGGNKPAKIPEDIRAELTGLLAFDIEVFAALKTEFDRRWAMHPAASDPNILINYRSRLERKRKIQTVLHRGQNPFVKGDKP